MPRLVHRNPTYRRHRSGQAFVVINGTYVYLGPHGTKASRTEYDRVIAEWLANGRRLPSGGNLKVADLILAYWKHVKAYYRTPDGRKSGKVQGQRASLKVLKRLYALVPVADFGPRSLKAVRQAMVEAGLSRGYRDAKDRLESLTEDGREYDLARALYFEGVKL